MEKMITTLAICSILMLTACSKQADSEQPGENSDTPAQETTDTTGGDATSTEPADPSAAPQ
jgi:major membrane immunogen (membrane-anchored lipoprotein)